MEQHHELEKRTRALVIQKMMKNAFREAFSVDSLFRTMLWRLPHPDTWNFCMSSMTKEGRLCSSHVKSTLRVTPREFRILDELAGVAVE